jgi:hypothetical protein
MQLAKKPQRQVIDKPLPTDMLNGALQRLASFSGNSQSQMRAESID